MRKNPLQFNETPYEGVIRIVSGGQCGADRGGLEAALQLGIPTGGFAPRGWRTHFGPAPELETVFNLTEDTSPTYPPRTKKNVLVATGTIIIGTNTNSPGTILTRNLAHNANRPYKLVQLVGTEGSTEFELISDDVSNWLLQKRIKVLNVAGNRDKSGSFHHDATISILYSAILKLKSKLSQEG